MKKTFRTILAGALALLTVSCYDDSALRNDLEDLEDRVTKLEDKLNSEVATINTTIGTMQQALTALGNADENFTTELSALATKLDQGDGVLDGKITTAKNDLENAIKTLKGDYASLAQLKDEMLAELVKIGVSKVEKNAAGNAVITFTSGETLEVPAKPATGIVTIIEGKWAVVGADGKTTVLDAQLHPDTKIEFQVDPQTGELKYSLGGQFVSTGAYVAGETFSVVTNVVEGDGIVTLTIGGVEYDLPLVSTNTFEIVSGKVFFDGEETKAIAIKLDGMVSSMVASKPKGWEVSLTKGGGLNVTAPALEMVITEEEDWSGDIIVDTTYVAVNGGDMSGAVEVWVVLEDGKTVVGNLAVAIAEAPADIRFDAEGNVTYKFPVSDIGNGRDTPEFVFFGAVKGSEFDKDAVFASILAFAKTYNAPGVYTNWGEDEIVTLPIEELVGEAVQVGSSYVFWAIHKPKAIGQNPDGSYLWDVTAADIQLVYLNPTKVNVAWNVSPFSISADVEVAGAESFYALACDKFAWEQVREALEMNQVKFNQLFAGLDAVKLVLVENSTYNVDFSTWGVSETDLEEGYRNEIYPENDYVLGIIPADPSKVIADYTIADLKLFEQSTKSMTAGGKAKVEYGMSKVGYDKVNFEVTLSDCFRAFYKYFSAAQLADLGLTTATALEEYALDNYLDFGVLPADIPSYPVSAQNMPSGSEITLVILALDENGGYVVSTKTETTKSVTYAGADAISIEAISVDKTNAGSPKVTFEVTGATKLILGEKIRNNTPTDDKIETTAVNILGIYPTNWAQYTYVNVVEGKATVTLNSYDYYTNWVVTALSGTTAGDVQLMQPIWLSKTDVDALPATPTEEESK